MKLTEKELLYLQAKEKYYAGEPIMEDWEFDELEAELNEDNSPAIEMVGYKTKGVKGNHLTPMKSLGKIQFQHGYTPIKEFYLWAANTDDQKEEYEGSPKFDGNAINIIYKGGKLIKAFTRGDGEEGQDITEKIRHRVPITIPIDKTLEIRGELVIKIDTFNKKYGPGTSYDYKNPRNFVAGMLNKDNLDKSILNDLDFMGFEIKMNKDTWMGHPFEHLAHWGFNEVYNRTYYRDKLNSEYHMNNMHQTWSEYRASCPYQIDGWVLKMGNHRRTPNMESSHHPKWALAIKFPAKVGRTKIIGIDWNLGSTGIIVPTGILEPVDLDGSTVQRVSLHNFEWADNQLLGIGADISIVKSGDIIPKVHKIHQLGERLQAPDEFMGQKVLREGPHLKVEDPESLPKFKAIRLHLGFVILGMKGIGPAMAERLVAAGYEYIADIFGPLFNKTLLIQSGEFVKGRELDILLSIVDKVKEIEDWQVIAALKFDGVGKTMSKQISNYHSEVDYDFAGLEKAAIEKFMYHTPEMSDLNHFYGVLKTNGIKIILPEKIDLSKVGGFYEMTGKPSTHKVKAEFVKEAKEKGYIHDKLNKNCNFLITDSLGSSSSKMKKAEKLGIEIVTYDDFMDKYIK